MEAIPKRSIGVRIPLSVAHGRIVLEGVLEWARTHRDWWISIINEYAPLDQLKLSSPAGIISFVYEPELRALASEIPIVSAANTPLGVGLPAVYFDDFAVGQLAAEHLLSCGLRNFAFVGSVASPDAAQRFAGFQQRLKAAGHSVHLLDCEKTFGGWVPFDQEHIADQLKLLPTPCGLFAAWDLIAYHLTRVCEAVGIQVPEQIAIIGVDNDPVLCNASKPPLSSVRVPSFEIGYRAAEMLAALIAGGPVPEEPLLLAPLSPVVRMSTEVIAVPDEKVAQALRYIREHAHECAGVSQMWEALGIPRKAMELRFRRALGRSALQELTRMRIERAKQLLLDTSYNSEELAHACGFATASYMISLFRKHVGVTPTTYRESLRRVADPHLSESRL